MRVIIFLFTLLTFSSAYASECLPNADNCGFYNDCVEQKINCGRNGYAISYGEYYCNRFSETFSVHQYEFSSKAQHWRKMTAVCLQKEITETVDFILQHPAETNKKDCSRLRSSAYSQHAHCYTQTGSSICKLPTSDILAIFRHRIIEYKDLFFSRGALAQIAQVQRICLRQLKTGPKDSQYNWWKNEVMDLKNYL